MTIRRSVTLLVSAAALMAAACSTPTAPTSSKACDVVTGNNSNLTCD
jgi:hypothetical protein